MSQDNASYDWQSALPDSEWLKITPGDPEITMVVREIERRTSRFRDERGNEKQELVVTVDVDGEMRMWSPNIGAVRELASANVGIGDMIKVSRGADRLTPSGFTQSTWTIVKATAPAPGGGQGTPDDDSIPFGPMVA